MNQKTFSAVRQKQNLLIYFALSAITLAGGAFRFYKIGKQPLWLDEAFSVWMSGHSIADIIKLAVDIDQHPPLYHILLNIWIGLGGNSEAWVRSLSALFGILTIIVIFSLGKTLSGPLVGLLAALVLAFSPFHIQYAQEARTYSLLTVCASMSMLMLARLLLDPRTSTQAIGQQLKDILQQRKQRLARAIPEVPQDRVDNETGLHAAHSLVDQSAQPSRMPFQRVETDLNWLGYILFTALTLFGHNTAIFLPVATNLFVFGLMLFRRSFPALEGQMQAPSFRNWFIAQLGVFLLWCPWLVAFYLQAVSVAGNFWIPSPTVEVVLTALKAFLLAYLPSQIRWQSFVWGGYIGAFFLAFWKYRRKAGHFFFLAAFFLTPFLGELLISLRRPIFYDRTLIWCTIPLYVLIAVGISQLRFRSYILTAVIMLVTLNGLSIGNFFQNVEKERWDLAAVYVGDKLRAGDIIIFNAGWAQIPFDYYFAPLHRKAEEFGAPQTMFENGELEPHMTEKDLPRLRGILQGHSRVWLVYSHNWWTDPKSLIQKTLRTELRLMSVKNFNGMQIQLYGAR